MWVLGLKLGFQVCAVAHTPADKLRHPGLLGWPAGEPWVFLPLAFPLAFIFM